MPILTGPVIGSESRHVGTLDAWLWRFYKLAGGIKFALVNQLTSFLNKVGFSSRFLPRLLGHGDRQKDN